MHLDTHSIKNIPLKTKPSKTERTSRSYPKKADSLYAPAARVGIGLAPLPRLLPYGGFRCTTEDVVSMKMQKLLLECFRCDQCL